MEIKYPENEHIEVTNSDIDGIPNYVITRERHGMGAYFLYKVKKNGSLTRFKESNSPLFKEVYP